MFKQVGIGTLTVLAGLFVLTSPAAATASSLAWSAPEAISGSDGFEGVSCPSTNLCVAVGYPATVTTSTNPTGGPSAWSVAQVVTGEVAFTSVSCPSTIFCVAVGAEPGGAIVAISTNPTGGAGAWSVTNLAGHSILRSVSCPSVSLCIAGDSAGDVVASTNPTGGAGAWTTANVDASHGNIRGVSCPTASLCVAADELGGNVVTSTNPTGGAGAWTLADVDGSNYLASVSCASVSLCVATDYEGNVVTSTNPTGGAGTWAATAVNGAISLLAISCPSENLCITVGNHYGYVESKGIYNEETIATSTNPTGGAGAWTDTGVEVNAGASGTDFLSGVACASASLCLAVTGNGSATAHPGKVLIGMPPGAGIPPTNTSLPMISGSAQVGQSLTCAPGSWSGTPAPSFTYQWQRDGGAIGGSTGASYVVQGADAGHTLNCVVTATNLAGQKAASSAGVAVPATMSASGGGGEGPAQPPAVARCTAPKLKGKTLSQAKKLLARSHCRLGKVRSAKTHHTPKVVGQNPTAGKTLPADAKVAVKLG